MSNVCLARNISYEQLRLELIENAIFIGMASLLSLTEVLEFIPMKTDWFTQEQAAKILGVRVDALVALEDSGLLVPREFRSFGKTDPAEFAPMYHRYAIEAMVLYLGWRIMVAFDGDELRIAKAKDAYDKRMKMVDGVGPMPEITH